MDKRPLDKDILLGFRIQRTWVSLYDTWVSLCNTLNKYMKGVELYG